MFVDGINSNSTNYMMSGLNTVIVCSTAVGTNAKTATAPDAFALDSNLSFKIKFTNGNTASSPTLKLNSTTAKSITFLGSKYLIANAVYDCFYDGTNYVIDNSVREMAYCKTAGGTSAKTATMPEYVLQNGTSFPIIFTVANSYASAITLNVNGTGAKSIYINGSPSSNTNYTIPAGIYICFYYDNYYHIDTQYTVPEARKAGKWLTERNISISDSDGANTGTAVAVDGSANKTLKLPATIKATLTGSATSAGKLTTARKTYVTLGTASTSTTRDWSGDTTIPVNGTLNVANGGTGQTSLSNVTVGNASKLGNKSVQTTSIGGTTTETGNHWSYVDKAKFTTSGGYIVYSNGLILQWGHVASGTSDVGTANFGTDFSNTNYKAVATVSEYTGGQRDTLRIESKSVNKMTILDYQITSGTSDMKGCDWIAIGY